VSIYVPNVGEMEMLKALVRENALMLGLYKTPVTPDGNSTIATLTPLTVTGGYAPIALTNDITEAALATSKWYLATDINGRAAAQYNDVPVEWVFDAANVALAETAYGIYGYTLILPFDAGATEIKVGDKIKSAGGATAIVTAVVITSGSWGAGTAAGWLCIKTQTSAFVNDEAVFKFGEIATVSIVAAGTGYAVGDIVTITQSGAAGAKVVVSAVNAGAVTGVVVVDGGAGYAAATGLPTVKVTGAGDNALTLTIATVKSTAYATTNTGANADSLKKLMFLEAFTSGYTIDTVGQKITYVPKITLSTT
jgi:hypothetical protein